jgi:hypothetical protein
MSAPEHNTALSLKMRIKRWAKRQISRPTAKCPVCHIIANAIIQWRKLQIQWRQGKELEEYWIEEREKKLGDWQGFLDRRECDSCQMIVRYMKNIRLGQTMFEPLCPLKLIMLYDGFWIQSVGVHICSGEFLDSLNMADALHRILMMTPITTQY